MRAATRKALALLIAGALPCAWIAYGQSRNGNWPTAGGDAQRSGWSATETFISKDSVKDLRLLWKVKLEASANGSNPVHPPLIVNRLISYRGFKELGFVATSADIVYAVDLDLGKIFWTRHLEYSVREPQVTASTPECPGGLTATPTMPVSGGGGGAAGGAGGRGNPFIGGAASVYAISSDGRLHRLNISTGDDMTQPVSVIPANANASSLLMTDNVIYTTTTNNCNGVPNAVWAIDLNAEAPKVRSFPVGEGVHAGAAVMGGNGSVYVETGERRGSEGRGGRVLSLSARGLDSKGVIALPSRNGSSDAPATPVVFTSGRRDILVAPCKDSLCVMDSDSAVPGSETALSSRRGPVQLATWQDGDGRGRAAERWILAPVVGTPGSASEASMPDGSPKNGYVAAFKVEEDGSGKSNLKPLWVSRDIPAPQTPVVVNGVVFALSAGELDGDGRLRRNSHATLYALDARTGKELYSSRNLMTAPAALSGLSAANGRVYFGGLDGMLYAFGIYMEH